MLSRWELCWWWWWGWMGWKVLYTLRWMRWRFCRIRRLVFLGRVLEQRYDPIWNLECHTLFLLWPGVLKGVNIVTFTWLLLLRLWRVLKWCSVMTQWLQMSSVSPVLFTVWAFDDVRASSFQKFYHCPCQAFQLRAVLFLRKESNLFFHL